MFDISMGGSGVCEVDPNTGIYADIYTGEPCTSSPLDPTVYGGEETTYPVVFTGGDAAPPVGQPAGTGGSGLGSFLTSLGQFGGGLLRGSGIITPTGAGGGSVAYGNVRPVSTLSASQGATVTALVAIALGGLLLFVVLKK